MAVIVRTVAAIAGAALIVAGLFMSPFPWAAAVAAGMLLLAWGLLSDEAP